MPLLSLFNLKKYSMKWKSKDHKMLMEKTSHWWRTGNVPAMYSQAGCTLPIPSNGIHTTPVWRHSLKIGCAPQNSLLSRILTDEEHFQWQHTAKLVADNGISITHMYIQKSAPLLTEHMMESKRYSQVTRSLCACRTARDWLMGFIWFAWVWWCLWVKQCIISCHQTKPL